MIFLFIESMQSLFCCIFKFSLSLLQIVIIGKNGDELRLLEKHNDICKVRDMSDFFAQILYTCSICFCFTN